MTTEPALLAQLQNAWNQTVATEPTHPMKCPQHIDPQVWLDEPAPGRLDWIRTTCRLCHGFIGYRPANNES